MLTGAAPLLARILDGGDDHRPALCGVGDAITYGELRRQVFGVRDALVRNGMGNGDRIAICLPKAIVTVTAILGIVATGATYVPLNPRLSLTQLRQILADLRPTALIAGAQVVAALRNGVTESKNNIPISTRLRLATIAQGGRLEFAELLAGEAPPESPTDLAVILYTSGTTGQPKGIMLTWGNIESFVDWAAETFALSPLDCLANHAPLHFDLSIFDIFCGLSRHAGVCLIDETTARFAGAVRQLIAAAGVTVWYSVPTALVRLQERRAFEHIASLRMILFAGEVFPVPALRRLMRDVPAPEYVNLYGPTETNVCTAYRLAEAPASDFDNVPIGWPCRHLDVRLLDPDGAAVAAGEIGEICVSGPAVMHGYWGQAEATAARRLPGRLDSYRTGDYAYDRGDGALVFVGRRDQQIKLRGHRIETLALETVLNGHPRIRDAAVVFIPDAPHGGALKVFVVPRQMRAAEAELRAFIADRLPPHYQPDRVEWLEEMPLTANGKCDRARLRSVARLAVAP